jgi:inosine-uridine nucleoside N-ribohydrolase
MQTTPRLSKRPASTTTRNALAIIELAGVDVPLAMGCAGPLACRRVGTAPVHGKGGLDGTELPEPKRQPVGAAASACGGGR